MLDRHDGIVFDLDGTLVDSAPDLRAAMNRLLAEHGAVSEAVTRSMAGGAIRISGADLAVAVSGVAGPTGGSEEKPVGTVWFAWSRMSEEGPRTDTSHERFDGDREAVRRQTVVKALSGLIARVTE